MGICALDDGRTGIDSAIIRQSITRTKLEPRWCPTGRMGADGLTKDRADPIDLLRSILKSYKYQLADEQLVVDRKTEERDRRKEVGKLRNQSASKTPAESQSLPLSV